MSGFFMDGNYLYTGIGILAIILLSGIIFTSDSLQQKEGLAESNATITLSIESKGNENTVYFSALPAEDLFSGSRTINFSSINDPEKKIECEFSCTKAG